MHITTFASGSKGNCAVVSSNGTHILIDAGISLKRLSLGLAELSLKPTDIYAVLISHEHSDHIACISALSKKYGVPILAPPTTADYICREIPDAEDFTGYLRFDEDFLLRGISVRAFRTPHDTPQSAGFRLWDDSGSFGCCTDLGHVTTEVFEHLAGVGTAMLEANHDVEMLKRGSYPAFLKRRILSSNGHLSNDNCARLAVHLAEYGAKSFTLAHLSEENNTPEKASLSVRNALADAGFADVEVTVAPPKSSLSIEAAGALCVSPAESASA